MAGVTASDVLKKAIQFNIITLGNSGVGKTALILWFMYREFSPSGNSTIATAVHSKTVECDGDKVDLQIWDTAGQERYARLDTAYIRRADAAILCYDITDMESFEDLNSWISSYFLPEDILMVLVACKTDLDETRTISADLGRAKAAILENGLKYFETSVKNGCGVNEVFNFIAVELLSRKCKEKWSDSVCLCQKPQLHNRSCKC